MVAASNIKLSIVRSSSVRSTSRNSKEWLVHRGHRTFEIAERLDLMAEQGLAMVAQFRDEERETEMIANWSKDTLVHKCARWAAHEMFYDETSGPYVRVDIVGDEPGELCSYRYLSVTMALQHYEIEHDVFVVPSPDGEVVRVGGNLSEWQESDKVANSCYEYFSGDLMWSEPYQQLLDQLADEVFHTVFANRALLYGLNWIASRLVSNLSAEKCAETPEVARLFRARGAGKLKRTTPPAWARKAVFHRDRGRCTYCRTDLTGVYDSLGSPNFDHMIPLAIGGLNDVTNLQLLCWDCNGAKSDKPLDASENYRRWFPQ
ncbi:HNH endonuclease [Nocardia cyriacigeorgica]|uniref:HNH endonuclease n=1 Tax=Nocardia cyriacigeorgica TaxID=135487 RepID=UPI001895116E|nr:HNH endonuclease [Nocardia cyriacigeorgica]MBF6399455.1 HNH endonuclease [Nocardia cyriacigeorgica]MBF6405085.1 HNH endonuclease [Nocardia cyriacigeorgica]